MRQVAGTVSAGWIRWKAGAAMTPAGGPCRATVGTGSGPVPGGPVRRRGRSMAVAAAAVVLLASGCTGSTPPEAPETVELRFSWWGGVDRAQATQRVIDTFQKQHPGITVKGEYTDFNAYFDDLGTQVAAGRAPDVMTMGGGYAAEFSRRGTLLDLATVADTLTTDQIDTTALSDGTFGGKQYGIPTGFNTLAIIADATVFRRAGVPLPDDATWTWQDLGRIARAISAKSPKGTYGVADYVRPEALELLSRQRGESLYTAAGGVGISERTLKDMWTMTAALSTSGAAPPAAVTSDLTSRPAPEQSLMGRGLVGMQLEWSNQLTSLGKSSKHELRLLRVPGDTVGSQRGMWLQASQLYMINAASRHPEEAAVLTNFLVNSVDAGKLILTDRGVPANRQVRQAIAAELSEDQRAQATFVDAVEEQFELPLTLGPSGSTDIRDIIQRMNEDVLFGRKKPAAAAAEFRKLVKVALRQ